MSVTSFERKVKIASSVLAGGGLRATERSSGSHRDVVKRWLVAVGSGCDRLNRDLVTTTRHDLVEFGRARGRVDVFVAVGSHDVVVGYGLFAPGDDVASSRAFAQSLPGTSALDSDGLGLSAEAVRQIVGNELGARASYAAAVALRCAYRNFCEVSPLRGGRTPAMAAGAASRVLSVSDLVDAALSKRQAPRRSARLPPPSQVAPAATLPRTLDLVAALARAAEVLPAAAQLVPAAALPLDEVLPGLRRVVSDSRRRLSLKRAK